jgi:hypothetical protein
MQANGKPGRADVESKKKSCQENEPNYGVTPSLRIKAGSCEKT